MRCPGRSPVPGNRTAIRYHTLDFLRLATRVALVFPQCLSYSFPPVRIPRSPRSLMRLVTPLVSSKTTCHVGDMLILLMRTSETLPQRTTHICWVWWEPLAASREETTRHEIGNHIVPTLSSTYCIVCTIYKKRKQHNVLCPKRVGCYLASTSAMDSKPFRLPCRLSKRMDEYSPDGAGQPHPSVPSSYGSPV